jgi:DNA-binding MurR/RpiR family transcriptional regulator
MAKAEKTPSILTEVSKVYYQLTSAEKKVADYVSAETSKVPYQSISELASACGVADATVSRFCRRLGCNGFSAFKLAVASTAMNIRSADGPLSGEVTQTDSIPVMCRKISTSITEAVAQTQELVDPKTIRKAADILLKANKVLCMGQGGSMIMAEEAAHMFTTTFGNFFAIRDNHIQAINAAQLSKDDVVLYFSYSGATRDLLDILPIVQKRKATSILITRFPNSPGAALADVILQCGSNENPLQLGSAEARVAQIYLLDVLLSEMCRRDVKACEKRREDIAAALSAKHI